MSLSMNSNYCLRPKLVFLFAPLFCLAFSPFARSAETWKPPQLIQPKELAGQLATGKEKPLIIQVGFLTLYKQSHIPESLYCGPASKPEGLEQLQKCLAKVPPTRQIIIYCGCCPWKDCPNVKPAYLELTKLGYKNFKVLDIPQSFGQDWVKKGFPVAAGE
jgi:thiosulfate/3-mercaptopyruvate sulfurtransferase